MNRCGELCAYLSTIDDVATLCAHLHIADRRNEVDALAAATALVHWLIVVTATSKISRVPARSSLTHGWVDFSWCVLCRIWTQNRSARLCAIKTDNVALSFVRVLNDVLAEFLG
jgi:hypothetical protein